VSELGRHETPRFERCRTSGLAQRHAVRRRPDRRHAVRVLGSLRDMADEVLEELLSQDRAGRARLVRRPDGLIQIHIERRVSGDEYGPPYWSRVGHQVVLADSIERARELAHEGLAALA
jgi:hypothetical protein